jgi:hypothetical protein
VELAGNWEFAASGHDFCAIGFISIINTEDTEVRRGNQEIG